MKSPKIVHIALGSNEGERFDILQNAVNRIFEDVGEILKISSVYETASWGFAGNTFLNACISVSTRFSAEEVLRKLLAIEAYFGQKRHL